MSKNATTSDLRECKLNDALLCSLGIHGLTRGKVYYIHMVAVKGPLVLNDDGQPIQVSFETDVFIPMPKSIPEGSMYSSVTTTTETFETIEDDIPSDEILWDGYANSILSAGRTGDVAIKEADQVLKAFKKKFVPKDKGEQNA